MTEKRKSQRLGAPPADWLSQSDVIMRGSAETQKLPRIGGPPREFGDGTNPGKRTTGPLTMLIVSENKDAAAYLALALAGAQVSIRLALSLFDVEPLLEGSTAVFAVVPRGDHPIARSLASWGEGRVVFALATGNAVVPSGPCAGTVLGLGTNQLQLVTTVNSGGGSGSVSGQVANPVVCDGYLQLIEAGACGTSNVVRVRP